jgi:hypothetical protein
MFAASSRPQVLGGLAGSHTDFGDGFEPERIALRADAPVRLLFDNRLTAGNSGGSLEHDCTIDRDAHGWLPVLLGPEVQLRVKANTQATTEFRLPPGSYTYYCSVYQHREDGMVGTLIVK